LQDFAILNPQLNEIGIQGDIQLADMIIIDAMLVDHHSYFIITYRLPCKS